MEKIEVEPSLVDQGIDILARLNVYDRPRVLVCEVKSNGQPRNVQAALLQLQLHTYVSHFDGDAASMFPAPYLSPEAQTLFKENNVAFLDLVGNARLALDNVFIERRVCGRPPADRHEEKFDRPNGYGPDRLRRFVGDNPSDGRTADQWQQDGFGQVDAWLRALGLR